MKLVHVLVEGATEETFVDDLMGPALPGLLLNPVIVKTRTGGAQPEKGGTVAFGEFLKQLQNLLNDSSAALVTTMLDYQGLGSDFPGRTALKGTTPPDRVRYLEQELAGRVSHPRFLPYLALHEFEAMLFVDPDIIASVIQERRLLPGLREVRAKYPRSPEDINDSPATSPSARIETLCAEVAGTRRLYRKRFHGGNIIRRIGIARIRQHCPHFDGWFEKLEKFAQL